MKDIKTQLEETLRGFKTHEKVGNRLLELDQKVQTASKDLAALSQKMDNEAEDISELEKLSLRSLFHKVLGSKEQQIEKERQEYLELSLKYDEAKKSLELLEYERGILEKKYEKGKGLETRLNHLIQKREKEILRHKPEVARQVNAMVQEIQKGQGMIFEMEEALAVGQSAQQLIDQMIGYLNQAQTWGQWDMAGHRRQAGRMKYAHIDRAKDLAYKVKFILQQFEKELRDVYQQQSFELHLNFDSFSSFTDIFFDNLLTDWLVQQKIQNTLSNVRSIRDKVIRLMHSLQAEIPRIEQQILRIEEKRQELIANA